MAVRASRRRERGSSEKRGKARDVGVKMRRRQRGRWR